MARRGMIGPLVSRLRHPKTTVRWRLTLLYGGLFLACGAALLAVTYTLVAHAALSPGGLVAFGPPERPTGLAVKPTIPPGFARARTGVPPQVRKFLGSPGGREVVRYVGSRQRIADLHQLEIESGIALAIMAIISCGLGWLVAGRVLAPLRTIIAETQQISEDNLDRRLALPGPRDELRTMADTIDGLLERLQDAFDAQRRFVANASHELRTPLTAVRALLEMAVTDREATVETFRETCREALEESEQQEELIDSLLALAQGQRGLDRRDPVDLGLTVAEAVRAHHAEASASDLELETVLEPAPIAGDRHLIARLVSNLIENAIRHNTRGGRVRIEVRRGAERAVLVVANTGPAVPASEIERLVQPFQRQAPERRGDREGFGLGLSIVSAIATAHEAELDIRPGESGGLRVEVRFVLARRPPREATSLAVTSPVVLRSG